MIWFVRSISAMDFGTFQSEKYRLTISPFMSREVATPGGGFADRIQGTADMEDHETRRKIIRQWMALPKDKRQTADQAAAFAKRAVEQNKFQRR